MLEHGSVVMPGGTQEQMAKEGQDVMLLCRLVLPGGNDGPICLRRSDHGRRVCIVHHPRRYWYTVFPQLNARAFIFFGVRFTRRLNGAGVYTGPAFISLC